MDKPSLRCIIVDDEDLAIALLQEYIRKTDGLELAGATTQPMAVAQLLQETDADLLFTDIQMPALSGLQLAEQIQQALMIVFTTAYSQYAIEGFRLNAIDYLQKPFSYERFVQAVDKCRDYQDYRLLKQSRQQPDHLYVRADGRMIKITLSDILFIEGRKQYIKIFIPGKQILTLESMKNMEAQLPARQFLRVHKSYIVATAKVDMATNDTLHIGQHVLAIGKTYRSVVKQRFS
jgi:two-component system, LytTR family, response regulator